MIPRQLDPYAEVGFALLVALVGGLALSVALSRNTFLTLLLIGGLLLIAVAYLSPRFAFYALLGSAMLNRFEYPFWAIELRIDQLVLLPVLLGIAPRLVADVLEASSEPGRPWRVPAFSAFAFCGFALFISINLLSSYLYAPLFLESLKIVAWFVLSFLAFAVTYYVVGRYVGLREAVFALLASGFISGAVGVFFYLLWQYTGVPFGVQPYPDPETFYTFKALGTFFEANIFGSFQAFTVIMAISLMFAREVRGQTFVLLATGVGMSICALAVSLTRAAWLGLLAGLLVLVFLQFRSGRLLVSLSRLAIVALIGGAVLVQAGLGQSLGTTFQSIATEDSGRGSTLAFRLQRFETALDEWPTSPILGLGTNSFGQRHGDPTRNYEPDYLPNLSLVTLYDTGVLGFLALFAVFGVLVWGLMRVALRGEDSWRKPLALAVLCGFFTLFVAYQATNAFWYSYNWIVIAIAVRLCQGGDKFEEPD